MLLSPIAYRTESSTDVKQEQLFILLNALQAGASSFVPLLNHLVGQPSTRFSSSGYDSAAANTQSSSGSGLIGCLASKDWAVRRAAADAIRATVLLLGPAMEPDGCWMLGDPGSLTYKCLNALESQGCKFDKVCLICCSSSSSSDGSQEKHSHTCHILFTLSLYPHTSVV